MKLDQIINNIHTRAGIQQLNPMQQAMAATDARQVMLLAPTGSGKTLAFAIYMLRRVKPTAQGVQAVVIAPSRELVLQIFSVVRPLATDIKTTPLYGGHPMVDEVNTLTASLPGIIIATPGRLLDHLQRGNLRLDKASTLILDEYDKSLELGFADEMSRIVKRMPGRANTLLTSATRLNELPPYITLDTLETLDYTASTPAPRHRMQVVEVPSPHRDKLPTLLHLVRSLDNGRTVIFVNHRESAERVHQALVKAGIPAGLYHGGLEQRLRQQALDLLDNGTTPVLVSTDLASRGIDIDNIRSVIHYHLPPSAESWTHRNGRTARQDATGTIYAIIHDDENRPDYLSTDRTWHPDETTYSANPVATDTATIHINAGRREKISRGDIAGYLIKTGGLDPAEVGKIKVNDHDALVAVPAAKVQALLAATATQRLKNTRVRLSLIRP